MELEIFSVFVEEESDDMITGSLGKCIVGVPIERIVIDIIGRLVRSGLGNRYLLVAIDSFYKWLDAFALAA